MKVSHAYSFKCVPRIPKEKGEKRFLTNSLFLKDSELHVAEAACSISQENPIPMQSKAVHMLPLGDLQHQKKAESDLAVQ